MASTKLKAVLLAGVTAVALVAVAIPGSSAAVEHSHASSVNWSTVTHLTTSGPTSMAALVAAAEKEGHLNVITLPTNWANYGTIMTTFTKLYHIAINSENPEGSSQDELNAIKADAGRSDDPDVLDVGQSFGIEAANAGELAPYRVQTWAEIPASQKATGGDWYADYGGYVAIGCNTKTVKVCPTSFKQMLTPGMGYKIGINNNPTEAGAAFAAVFAAALANGGSFNNIKPGVDYFQKLNKVGNFVATVAGPSTIQSGATNIVLWWDYLQASEINTLPGFAKTYKVMIPTDASYAAYYAQAINRQAPDPAAAVALGGVPLLDPGTEPVARGRSAPDRTALPRSEPPGERESVGRPAAGPRWRHQLPDPGPAGQGEGGCRTVLARRDGL